MAFPPLPTNIANTAPQTTQSAQQPGHGLLFGTYRSPEQEAAALALFSQLASGRTRQDQLNFAPTLIPLMQQAQQKQQAQDARNKTIETLRRDAPEIANMLAAGTITTEEAGRQYLKKLQDEKEAAKPQYTVINGRLVQTNSPNGIKVAADFSDPTANMPAAAKESKYWLTHPDEYTAYQQQRMDAEKAKNQPKPTDQFKTDIDTMKTYRGEDAVKTYQSTRDAYEKVRTSAQLGTAQGDIGLVYGFMKMLDPTSVVREGEYATAQNSGGISDTVINLYNKTLNGERLTPEQRQQFVEAAGAQYQNTVNNLNTVNQRYKGLADQYGVPTDRVLEQPKTYPNLNLGQKTTTTINGKPVTIERVE